MRYLLLPAIVCLSATSLCAEPEGPLEFTRIYVPVDSSEEWPNIDYAPPISLDSFEKWVKSNSRLDHSESPEFAFLKTVTLEANLTDGQLTGAGSFEVGQATPEANWLRLDGLHLAWSNARWASGGPVVSGANQDGAAVVAVEQPGTLNFDWTLLGRGDSDALNFDVGLPKCQVNRLILTLPAESVVRADPSLAVTAEAADRESAQRTWTIEGGGRNRIRFTILGQAPVTRSAQTLSKQRTSYFVNEGGIEFVTGIELSTTSGGLPSSFAVTINSDVSDIDVSLGNSPADWHVEPAGEGLSRITVRLTDLPKTTALVHIKANYPIELDTLLNLPLAALHGCQTLANTVSIYNRSPWELIWVSASDGTLTTTESSEAHEALHYQLADNDSQVSVILQTDRAELAVDSACSFQLATESVVCDLVMDVKATSGETFSLAATVSNNWKLGSVVAKKKSESEWRDVLIAAAETTRLGPSQNRVVISLQEPLRQGETLRLLTQGTKDRVGSTKSIAVSEFPFWRLDRAVVHSEIVQVFSSMEDKRVELVDESFRSRIHPKEMTAEQADRFAFPERGLLFDASHLTADCRIAITENPHRSSVEINCDVLATIDSIDERINLKITESTAPIEHLIVVANTPRLDEYSWSLPSVDENPKVICRAIDFNSSAIGYPHAFRIELPEEFASASLELLGAKKAQLVGQYRHQLCLPHVVGASTQSARVQVRRQSGLPLVIEAENVTALPALRQRGEVREDEIAGLFEHRHSETTSESVPAIVLARDTQEARVWSSSLDWRTIISTSGLVQHVAEWTIEHNGRGSTTIQIPPASELRSISISGQPATYDRLGDGRFLVSMPNEAKSLGLQVVYGAEGDKIAWLSRRKFQPPQIDMPAAVRKWTVLVPPNFTCEQVGLRRHQRLRDALVEMFVVPTIGIGPFEDGTNSQDGSPVDEQFPGRMRGYSFVLTEGDTGDLRLLEQRLLCVVGWSLFLLGAVVTSTFLQSRPWFAMGLCAAVVGLAVFFSSSLAYSACGVVWGTLSALLLGLQFKKTPALIERPQRSARMAVAQIAGLVTLLALVHVVCRDSRVLADEKAKPELVVIPVNEQGVPVGQVYTSKPLYRHIKSRVDDVESHDWLITKAVYSLNQVQNEGDTIDIRASYRLRTFQDGADIAIPLERDSFQLRGDWLLVDGKAVNQAWEPGSKSLAVNIPKSGEHRIELRLAAELQVVEGQRLLQVAIPPVPESYLILESLHEQRTPEIRVAARLTTDAREFIDPDAELSGDEVSLFSLAAMRQLELRLDDELLDNPSQFDADVLLWLTTNDGEVSLDARTQLSPVDGFITRGEFIVESASALKSSRVLGTLQGSASTKISSLNNPEQRPTQKVTSTWEQPTEQPVTLATSILLDADPGDSRIVLPKIQPIGARSVRTWLAISGDFKPVVETTDALEISLDRFKEIWGDETQATGSAFNITSVSDSMILKRVSTNSPARAKDQLTVQVQPTKSLIEYMLMLDKPVPSGFQQVNCSAELQVRSVTLQQAVVRDSQQVWVDVPTRWSRAPTGEVKVFVGNLAKKNPSDDGQNGELRLTIEATAPHADGSRFRLPVIVPELAEQGERRVDILMRNDVRMSDLEVPARYRISDVEARRVADHTHLASYTTSMNEASSVTATVQSNHDCFAGTVVTKLAFDGNNWIGTTHLNLNRTVSDAVSIQLAFPMIAAQSLEISPTSQWSSRVLSADQLTLLTLQPGLDLEEQYRVSWQYTPSAEDRFKIPKVNVVGQPNVTQLLALPTTLDQRNVEWNYHGLQPVESSTLDLGQLEIQEKTAKGDIVRIVQIDYWANLKPVEEQIDQLSVNLAHYEIAVHDEGRVWGRAFFDVPVLRSTELGVLTPEGCEILELQVGEYSCSPDGLKNVDGVSLFKTAAADLPQRITIKFLGQLSRETKSRITLPVPRLSKLHVDRTTWRVALPTWATDPVQKQGCVDISDSQLELMHLRRLTGTLRSHGNYRTTVDEDDLRSWFARWDARWNACEARYAAHGQSINESEGELDDDGLLALRRQRDAIAAWFDASSPAARLGPTQSDAFPYSSAELPKIVCFEKSTSDSLTIEFDDSRTRHSWLWWFGGAACLVLLMLATAFASSFGGADWPIQLASPAVLVGAFLFAAVAWPLLALATITVAVVNIPAIAAWGRWKH